MKIIYIGSNKKFSKYISISLEKFKFNYNNSNIFYIFQKNNKLVNNFILNFSLKKYKNFILEEDLNKKIIIFYGNCHLFPIQQMLLQNREFASKYLIWPIKGICSIKNLSYFKHPCFYEFCDIFVHQDIRKTNIYGEKFSSLYIIENFLKKESFKIAIPNVYRMPKFIYPQCDNTFYYQYKGTNLFFKDSILEKHLLNHQTIMKKESYFLELKKLNKFYNYERLKFILKLKTREQKWDIKVSGFINSNLETYNLFHDPNHPSFVLLNYIYKQLAFLLDIRPIKINRINVQNLNLVELPSVFDIKNNSKKYRDTGFILPIKNFNIGNYIKFYSLIWNHNQINKSLILETIFKFYFFFFDIFFYCSKFIVLLKKLVKNIGKRILNCVFSCTLQI